MNEMSKQQHTAPAEGQLLEGVDYYLENGYFVFTEYYLAKRGKCCGSGCRHCPYRKRNKNNHKKG